MDDEDYGVPADGDVVPVWKCNDAVVCVFDAMSTQWTFKPDGSRQGLRYEAIDCVVRGVGLSPQEWTPQRFSDLLVMEQEVTRT